MTGTIYEIDNSAQNISGTIITITILDYLEVIELNLNAASLVENVDISVPGNFRLDQNYPNPFGKTASINNSSTKIKFALPKKEFTKIKIYDILGAEVASLVNEELKPGHYEVVFNAKQLPSGVYIYSIIAGDFTASKKNEFSEIIEI